MARARAMARTRQWVHCSGVIAVGARAKTIGLGLELWLGVGVELWLGLELWL